MRATSAPSPVLDEDALFADAGDAVPTVDAPPDEVAEVEKLAARAPRPRIEAAAPPTGTAYTIDAMVGQVNGRAIYARSVFEPLADQLTALGRTLDTPTFRRRASELIAGRLDQLITDALIISEATRDLSEGERYGLRIMLQRHREDLLREWGNGSLAVAEDRLRAETGKGVDETLDAYRQQQLVRRYLMQQLLPRINVTRRDVERYYEENLSVYQPPTKRTIRMIKVDRTSAAAQVTKALEEGRAFKDVAGAVPNQYRPEDGGLWPEPIIGDGGMEGALGDAIKDLPVGEHRGPIRVGDASWWVYIDSEDKGQSRPLRDVQLDIERELRQNRFRYLSQRYRKRLYDEGSYDEVAKMTRVLLDVAESRYTAPPSASP